MTRVLLADDHVLVRAGLEQLLIHAGDIEVVGAAANGSEAIALVDEHEPDVVLMDLSMPVMDGIQATRAILGTHPDVRIVMLTSFSEQELVLEAIDAGAVGYLLKDADPDELVRGIRAAASGHSPLAPRVARTLLAARVDQRGTLSEITTREREVLALLGSGFANKEIARRLGISEKTVKVHVTSIFHRIGVADRTQAALWAERHGLVGDRRKAPAS